MRTVLVCVRTPLVAHNVAAMAARLGLSGAVRTAASDAEVMLRLAERACDVVLADTGLTRPDPAAFVRRVLARAPGAVVLLIGAEERGAAAAAIAAGARGLVQSDGGDLITGVVKAMLLLAASPRARRVNGPGAAGHGPSARAVPGAPAGAPGRPSVPGASPGPNGPPGLGAPAGVPTGSGTPARPGGGDGSSDSDRSSGSDGSSRRDGSSGRDGHDRGDGRDRGDEHDRPGGAESPAMVPVQRGDQVGSDAPVAPDPRGPGGDTPALSRAPEVRPGRAPDHTQPGTARRGDSAVPGVSARPGTAPASGGWVAPGRRPAGPAATGGPAGAPGVPGVTGVSGVIGAAAAEGVPGMVGVPGLGGAGQRIALTEREMQVLIGMADGKSNAEIGRELFVSEDTVKTHARRLFRKLGARDRAHAVAAGFRAGLVA